MLTNYPPGAKPMLAVVIFIVRQTNFRSLQLCLNVPKSRLV